MCCFPLTEKIYAETMIVTVRQRAFLFRPQEFNATVTQLLYTDPMTLQGPLGENMRLQLAQSAQLCLAS